MLVPVSTSFKNFRADKRSGFNILSFVNGDPEPNSQLCIHRLSCKFQNSVDRSLGAFINFIKSTVDAGTFERMEKVTRSQYLSPVWKNLKYRRITASIVHEMAHCRTIGGSLVDRVMGSARPFDNFAMARGRRIECDVLKAVADYSGINFKKCGLFISSENPIFAAPPDGITPDLVLEIKCPKAMKRSKIILWGPTFQRIT